MKQIEYCRCVSDGCVMRSESQRLETMRQQEELGSARRAEKGLEIKIDSSEYALSVASDAECWNG